MAPISCCRINFARSMTGVSGSTQSTPLCIASLTFMGGPPFSGVVPLYENSPGRLGATQLEQALVLLQSPPQNCTSSVTSCMEHRRFFEARSEEGGEWLRV